MPWSFHSEKHWIQLGGKNILHQMTMMKANLWTMIRVTTNSYHLICLIRQWFEVKSILARCRAACSKSCVWCFVFSSGSFAFFILFIFYFNFYIRPFGCPMVNKVITDVHFDWMALQYCHWCCYLIIFIDNHINVIQIITKHNSALYIWIDLTH